MRRITTDLGIGARRITVSTVGIVPGIRRLTTDPDMPPVRLAVSLHCANDEERTALLPANARNGGIHELMTALQDYIASTGRRITLEWALIAGENDNVSTARQLGRLIVQKYKLRPDMVHINVIPLNPTALYSGQASRKSAVNLFCDTLINEFSIACTPRVRRGIDIDAGCGQLTSSLIQQEEKQQNQNEREEQIHLVGYDIDFVNSGIPSPTNERLVDLASGPGLADFMAVASNSNSPRRSIVSSIGVFDPDDDDANDPDMDAVTDDTLQTFMTCTTNEGDAHDFDSDSFENPELESLFEKQEANRLVALIQGQTINIAALKTNERTTNTRE